MQNKNQHKEEHCSNIHNKETSVRKQGKTIRSRNALVGRTKYLGIHLERNLTWKAHIKTVGNKTMQHFVALHFNFKCPTLNRKLKTRLYKSLLRPILLPEVPVWGYAATSNMKKLEVVQNKTEECRLVGCGAV
jgi:hypothetical protein